MAERLSLELELLDKVGGPAKKAADALRNVENQAKKAQKALDFSSELSRTKAQFDKLRLDPKGFTDLVKAQKALREERQKLQKSVSTDHGGFLSSFKNALPFRSVGDYFKGAFWGHLAAHGVEKIAEGFAEGATKAVEVIYDGIKEAFKAIAKEQERVAGYDLTLGKKGSGETREDIARFSKQTAFTASQNQDLMLPLFRAGLTGQAARTAYATAQDLAAARGQGSSQEAVASGVDLFAKIQQRGGITTKQLAGAGLGAENVPTFFKDLGKTLHMSADAAMKLAAKPGGVDPQLLMNQITLAVNKQQGGAAGTGGDRAGKELAGQWNKLKGLPEEFFIKLAKSPMIPKISAAIGSILEKLDPDGPVGKRIFAALESAFGKLTDLIGDAITPENIDKAVDALEKMPDLLKQVWEWSKTIAEVWATMKVISTINSVAALAGIGGAGGTTAAGIVGKGLLRGVGGVAAAGLFMQADDHSINAATSDREKNQHKGQHLVDYGNDFSAWEDNDPNEFNASKGKGPLSNKVANISVGGVTVNVHPSKDDTAHTGQKAAQSVVDAMSDEFEKLYQSY